MPNQSKPILSVLPLMALLWACSDSPTDTPPPEECTVVAVGISGAVTELTVGATAQLTGNVTSSNCDPVPTVTWTTSSAAIATVSNSGLVTAVGLGEVTITAAAGGKSDNAVIEVTAIPIAEIRIAPENIKIAEGRGHQLVAEALDDGGETISGVTFTWSSDSPGDVEVDENGTVTGLTANGNATITATAEGVTGEATVEVVRSRLAFMWNHDADATGLHDPDSEYSYNSLAGVNTISHGAGNDGLYSATFGGQERVSPETEAIFVSGYDLAGGSYCNQWNWSETTLSLRCFDAAGNLANARWTAAHISATAFPGRFGFAWYSSPEASGNPSQTYSFNSSGGRILGVRMGEGVYRISFEGLKRSDDSQRESVIVNAYASQATCQVGGWNLTGDQVPDEMVIEVRCFGPDGAPMNSRFTVLLVEQPREDAQMVFALADQPTTAAYSPDNGAVLPTGDVTINRSAVGKYTVHFFGFHRTGDFEETFLISAVGDDPARCHVDQWANTSTPGGTTTVWVECFDPDGVAKDSPFSLLGLQ